MYTFITPADNSGCFLFGGAMKDLQGFTVAEIMEREDLINATNKELFDRGVTATVIIELSNAGFSKSTTKAATDSTSLSVVQSDEHPCMAENQVSHLKTVAMQPVEVGQQLPLDKLHEYPDHWFKPATEERMESLCASIQQVGILQPVIVRPIEDGYQIIAGHNRVEAARRLGRQSVPTHIKQLNDDEAVIVMVDTNLESRELLPSEKAWSYKFKLEAAKRQGTRVDLTSGQLDQKLNGIVSRDAIAAATSDSSKQIQRYIRLTELIPTLLDLVDAQKLAFVTAVALSYLSTQDQQLVLSVIHQIKRFPSEEQAKQLRTVADRGQLDEPSIEKIIMGTYNPRKAPSRRPKILRIETKQILSIFKDATTPQQAQDKAIEAINNYQWLEENAAEALQQLLSHKS